MIEVDVETTGTQWYAHDLFLVTFKEPGADPHVFSHPDQSAEIQQTLDRDDDFRAWNTKFDMHFLRNAGYRLPPTSRWHDGMVEAHIINEQRSVALKAVAGSMFGESSRDDEKRVKDWLSSENRRRQKEARESGGAYTPANYADVPRYIMVPYAAQDVLLTEAICNNFAPIFDSSPELDGIRHFERDVLGALYRVEERGLPVDRLEATKFEVHLAERLEKLHERCVELAGIKSFNPNSSAQIAEALKRRGADLSFVTKKKTGLSMDAENLSIIDDDLARAVLEFRADFKLLGTYLRPMLHESFDTRLHSMKAPYITDGRIHPSFNQVGARTGRMSCSDPNMQNWPRDDLRLRYLLRAEPGKMLVCADLDSIELRLFAGYAGGSIKDSLLRGEDMHTNAARSAGLGDRKRSTGVESARQRGKTLNYSIIYGAGPNSVRKAFGVSQDEARAILRRYHAAYPEVGILKQDMEWALQKRGYVKTAWGRHLRIDPRDSYRAVNYVIQGTAAEILKAALVRLDKAGVPVIGLFHDEILAEVDEADCKDAAKEIEEALTDHPRIAANIPLKAEAQIVRRWSEAKDRTFTPSYN